MPGPPGPSGLITLITDYGLADPFVGVMKGRILEHFPGAQIIDLTHAIAPQRPAAAGFWLARSFGCFLPGTVHVAVVDPGVGTSRAVLGAIAGGHMFLAPDNGLLERVVAGDPHALVVACDLERARAFGVRDVSATFHGRDLFAPLAAALAAGRCTITDLGALVSHPAPVPATADTRAGHVVVVDRFGNLITDIDEAAVAGLRAAVLRLADRDFPVRRTYADVAEGEYVALVNSFGVLEIARRGGSAADGLGVAAGAPLRLQDAGLA